MAKIDLIVMAEVTRCTLDKRRESNQTRLNSVISVHVGLNSVISLKIPSIQKYPSEEEFGDFRMTDATSFRFIIIQAVICGV